MEQKTEKSYPFSPIEYKNENLEWKVKQNKKCKKLF